MNISLRVLLLFLMSMKIGIENEIPLPRVIDLPYRHCQQ